jgi:hypothetical protein
MGVVVQDQKSLTATVRLSKADGTVKDFRIEANAKPRWFETDDFRNALKDIEDIDLAVEKAPARYIAPDVETERKLAQHISRTFKERPLGRCLLWISEQIKVPIRCDIDWDEHPLVSIKAEDKPVSEVLDNLAKQAKLEYVVRGRAVLVTKPERAAKLRLTPDKAAGK